MLISMRLDRVGTPAKISRTQAAGRNLFGHLLFVGLQGTIFSNAEAVQDDSFACALTLEGWINRPKCFQFLERTSHLHPFCFLFIFCPVCNGPTKCIFVRVVDTCAGCAKGSKHVDLTKAAFQALATLDEGTLQVNMRLATDPKAW